MTDTVKCVAIDDEPLALDVIRQFCHRLGGIELSAFTNPCEGMEYIIANKPEIVFLDIEMDDADGRTIAARLPEDTCFIFTTAYLHYALDGFDLDAVDYLHKPFSYSRFQSAFDKAMRRLGRKRMQSSGQSIVVKQEYSNINIPLDDIFYVEAMEGYSKIFRASGGCVVTRMILKNLLQMLPEEDFVRIHRSFIVPRHKIKSFNKREVYLNNGTVLPIGRQYAADIAERLKQ